MIELAIDASTYVGTVAVWRDGVLVAERAVAMRDREAERLMPAVAEAMAEADALPGALSRVTCGAGPGSFTSLRIAASIAKGIAAATDAPLHAVPSLGLVLAGSGAPPVAGRHLVVLDALRGECYAALYESTDQGVVRELAAARVFPATRVDEVASAAGAAVVAVSPEGPAPHARGARRLLEVLGGAPVDLDAWEPAYGRLPEAQVKWEAAQGRSLATEAP